ncbi:uncharacterized protein BO97DRAFT_285021 [Aspergillus homomorphus CBS 101889]|uniref:Uncharacterized protein n=1 Tax=Aspergillus homomorphus (strain CBS 101889) TaxID=1450537 RepID=A0A395I5G5_ASPHC|nr:hypothetical protein BO97DRAFT_285021 [Aspergillus homomorphus CBS 101889]RAL14428.1 hypothetical protein BO97DRAFT_285021 [Aspergillus homomorphus CBS 101889]
MRSTLYHEEVVGGEKRQHRRPSPDNRKPPNYSLSSAGRSTSMLGNQEWMGKWILVLSSELQEWGYSTKGWEELKRNIPGSIVIINCLLACLLSLHCNPDPDQFPVGNLAIVCHAMPSHHRGVLPLRSCMTFARFRGGAG